MTAGMEAGPASWPTDALNLSNGGLLPTHSQPQQVLHQAQDLVTDGLGREVGLPEAQHLLMQAKPGTLGVDRLVLYYALSEEVDPPALAAYRNGKQVPDLDYNLHVRVFHKAWGELFVRVDFNPSRALDPDGCTLASGDQARRVAEDIVFELDLMGLSPAVEPADIRLQLVDVTRDFVVTDPGAWLDAFRGIRAKNSLWQQTYVGKDGATETNISGAKGLHFKIYDKSRVAPNDAWAQKHNLRFEASLKKGPVCRKWGLARLGHLNTAKIAEAAVRLWDKSRYGTARLHPNVAQWAAQTPYEPSYKATLVGAYQAQVHGVDLGLPTAATVYRDLKKHGLLNKRGRVLQPSPGRRLDVALGIEVNA